MYQRNIVCSERILIENVISHLKFCQAEKKKKSSNETLFFCSYAL